MNKFKQKGYYAPDLSGCFIPFLILCGLGLLGLYKLGEGVMWLWNNFGFIGG